VRGPYAFAAALSVYVAGFALVLMGVVLLARQRGFALPALGAGVALVVASGWVAGRRPKGGGAPSA
jgi:hypothetical protein